MLWLPDAQDVCRRLPLADWSAAALLSAKATSGEPAVALVRGAVEHDAALCLWAVSRAACDGHDAVRTADALARWLAIDLHQVLAWSGDIQTPPDEPSWRERYRRLAALSLAVARRARSLAGTENEIAEQAFLFGLLHLAREWSTLDIERDDVGRPATFPDWLVAAIDAIHSSAADQGPEAVRCVTHARQECDEQAALTEYDRLTSAGPLALSVLASAAHSLALLENGSFVNQRVTAEKLAAMAEFAAGAGHEINNPIAVISGRVQLLLEDETNPQRRHELAVIHTQAMRVYEMISDMMLFARPPEPVFAECDLVAVARQVVEELAERARQRNATMRFVPACDALTTEADATQIAVVVRALCDNALSAAARGGAVTVAVGHEPSHAEPCAAVITVADDGPGIAGQAREHLFDPFFSGREAGRGLGMGLAKAWRIVNNHRGRIEVYSHPGKGTKFTVVLP